MTSGRPEVSPLPADANPTAGVGHSPADATLSEALLTVRKRKYLIAAIAALGIGYGFYKGTTQPRLYQATGTIEIRTGSSNQFRVNGSSGYGSASSSLQTQVAIIRSDTVLLTVARDLDLPNNAAFTGYNGPNRHLSLDDLNVRQGTLNGMNGDISVSIMPKTDLVQISCQTLDPKLSADIVNRLIREFIQRDLQSSYEATQRVSDFLSLQLRDLKQEVETQQEQLIDLQKRIGVLGFDPQHNQIQSTLDDLTRAVSAAQIARIQQQARFKTLSSMNPDALDGTIGAQSAGGLSTSLSGLRSTREQLMVRYAELNAVLGSKHPQSKALQDQINELNRQIADEQKRLIDQAHEAYVAASDNEQQTRGALEVEKAEAYKLRDDLVEYTLRQREFESNRTLLEGLSQRLRTAGIEAGLESTEVDIIDNAVPP
ncbi:MAG TPA: GumC family protein, partial [Acetobacteraceae bacterium]|nr:GumC family protein [Acetobacteraceae bacterium]